jgi:hypothetical protein
MASMSLEEMLAIGSVITAMPVVNAIPAVIAAPRRRHLRRPPHPGILPRPSRFMSSRGGYSHRVAVRDRREQLRRPGWVAADKPGC